jgi:hypothetical protein
LVFKPEIIENNTLQFPVYLVEGDNGQLGIDVYNYLVEKYCPNALDSNSKININERLDEVIYVTSDKYSKPIQITFLNVWRKSSICYFNTSTADIAKDIHVHSNGMVWISTGGGAE